MYFEGFVPLIICQTYSRFHYSLKGKHLNLFGLINCIFLVLKYQVFSNMEMKKIQRSTIQLFVLITLIIYKWVLFNIWLFSAFLLYLTCITCNVCHVSCQCIFYLTAKHVISLSHKHIFLSVSNFISSVSGDMNIDSMLPSAQPSSLPKE